MGSFASAVSTSITFWAPAEASGFGFAQQLECVGDVLHVLLPDLFVSVAGAQIVVALRQPEPALIDGSDLLARILEVLLLSESQKSIYVDQLLVRQQVRSTPPCS